MRWLRLLLATGLIPFLPAAASAQGVPTFEMTPAKALHDPLTEPLGAPADNAQPQEEWFRQNGRLNVRNVSRASITPVLPKGKGTGVAVVIAPGGGFTSLAMDTEGFEVARWLADHGIAAFVLKYRTQRTALSLEQYQANFNAAVRGQPTPLPPVEETPDAALQDGSAALAYVRQNSARFGIDPQKIGFMGFSAGGMLARSLGIAAAAKPAFVAAIYPRMNAVAVPADAPPLFTVLAADDVVIKGTPFALAESWYSAGRPVEFHLITSGGHGFGVGIPGTSAEGWLLDFERWLRVKAFLGGQ